MYGDCPAGVRLVRVTLRAADDVPEPVPDLPEIESEQLTDRYWSNLVPLLLRTAAMRELLPSSPATPPSTQAFSACDWLDHSSMWRPDVAVDIAVARVFRSSDRSWTASRVALAREPRRLSRSCWMSGLEYVRFSYSSWRSSSTTPEEETDSPSARVTGPVTSRS